MNRTAPYLVALAIVIAFIGGAKTAIDAKDVARNNRVKEINANVSAAINLVRSQKFLAKAKPVSDVCDLAPSLRCKNYSGGSCVHATSISLLRWTGDPKLMEIADEWRAKYRGGEWTAGPPHTRKMDGFGLKYVTTQDGDVELLEWACETRRGAGITYPAGHSIALIGHEGGDAILLDNNRVDKFLRIPWDKFVAHWKAIGGQGWCFVYDPPPPTPR